MDICIRKLDADVVAAIDSLAMGQGLSREEFLRLLLRKVATDGPAPNAVYAKQLSKLASVVAAQNEKLDQILEILTDSGNSMDNCDCDFDIGGTMLKADPHKLARGSG